MNSPIAILVVFAIFAQSHSGYCNSYGGQKQNVQNTNSDSCAIQEAEQITRDGALAGLGAMFSTPIRLLKKYGPNGGSPNTREDETAIQQSEKKATLYFAKAAEAGFIVLQKLRPKYSNLIQKISNRAFPMFFNGSDGINRATRLVYRKSPEEVQTEIDFIQPETVSSFVNGIAQYYIAMREATPGKPVILSTNEQAEEQSLQNISIMFRRVFLAIRYMLDALVNTKQSANTQEYLSKVQKAKNEAFSAAGEHVKILYNEIRRWANVQAGGEESCNNSTD